MALIETIWVVVNPKQHSDLDDIVVKTTPVKYVESILEAKKNSEDIRLEYPSFYTNEETAKVDAMGRMKMRDAIFSSLTKYASKAK